MRERRSKRRAKRNLVGRAVGRRPDPVRSHKTVAYAAYVSSDAAESSAIAGARKKLLVKKRE
jgi:hypothetical protein